MRAAAAEHRWRGREGGQPAGLCADEPQRGSAMQLGLPEGGRKPGF